MYPINHLYTTVSVPDRLYKKIAIQLERLVLIGALYLIIYIRAVCMFVSFSLREV